MIEEAQKQKQKEELKKTQYININIIQEKQGSKRSRIQ
jgi:hypothetical protein